MKAYLKTQMSRYGEGAPHRGRRTAPTCFVTLSREAGAGGYPVAEALAGLLTGSGIGVAGTPWTVFDRSLLKVVVEEHRLPEEFMKDLEAMAGRTVPPIVDEMLGLRPSARALAGLTCRTILNLAAMGNAILVGRGGAVVARDLPGGFHARLVGSPARRAEFLVKHHGLTLREAERLMEEEDDGRRRYVRRYLKADVSDPIHYDLVVNTDRLNHVQTAELLLAAFRIRHGLRPPAA
jgi:hypothetical protein